MLRVLRAIADGPDIGLWHVEHQSSGVIAITATTKSAHPTEQDATLAAKLVFECLVPEGYEVLSGPEFTAIPAQQEHWRGQVGVEVESPGEGRSRLLLNKKRSAPR